MRFFCLFSRLRALPKNTRRMPSAYALRHFPPSFFQKKFQKPRSRCRSSTHLTPVFAQIFFYFLYNGDLQRVVKPISERVCNFLNRAMLYRAHHTRRVAHAGRPARYRTHGTLPACSHPRPASQRQGNTSVSLPAAATAHQCKAAICAV